MFDSEDWLLDGDSIEQMIEIQPGEMARFTVQVEAPWNIGSGDRSVAVFEARMVSDDGRRFGEVARTVMTATNEAPPQIVAQPKTAPMMRGQRIVLTVDATSESPLRYRWRRHSVPLSNDDRVQGTTSPRLRLRGLDSSLAGDYDCVVTNDAGTVMTDKVSVEAISRVPRRPGERLAPTSPSAGQPLTGGGP